jgi:DNA modification methylase
MSTEEFGAFLLRAFKCMKEVSEAGCMTYVVMSAQEWGSLMNVMREAGYHWSSTIIWKKDSLVLSRKDIQSGIIFMIELPIMPASQTAAARTIL